MEKEFLNTWFAGFDAGIEKMDEAARTGLLGECGRACSESGTREIYIEAYKKSRFFDDFLLRIRTEVPEMNIEKNSDGSIVVIYTKCLCDLVSQQFIKSPNFCECSRQSLLYNWEAIFGEGKVEVTLLSSILQKDETCRFLIRFDRSLDFD